MRIAVVHSGWPLVAYTRDLVAGLRGEGHDVYVVATVLEDCGLVERASYGVDVELVANVQLLARVDRRLRRAAAGSLDEPLRINPPWVRRATNEVLARRGPLDLLIGVEKAGLDLAAEWSSRSGTPFVYYSLELYIEDHPELVHFAWQLARERACHARASGTIVQDPARWQVLRAANRIAEQPVFFLPIGAPARPSDAAPPARRTPALPVTLLSLGAQGPERYTHELINTADRLPPGFTIDLHGPVCHAPTRARAHAHLPASVRFSTQILPEHALPRLLAAADIGLALYRCNNANERLTAFSSQKVAMYLQAGLPIIAFRNDAYADLFARFPCGDMIDDISQVGAAAGRICDAYQARSTAAHAAFAAIYRLDGYWAALSTFLHRCAAHDRPTGNWLQ